MTRSITGFIREGRFERVPDERGILEELRLTTVALQAAIIPEAAELDLQELEGKYVTVEGDLQGQWVYSTQVVSGQYFRANIGIVLINKQGDVLALERVPKGSGRWQMAQGGINELEEPRQSAKRELMEELGLDAHHLEFLDEYPDWLAYELPPSDRKAKHGRGQVQKWFLVRFIGRDEDIDLSRYARQQNKEAEFGDLKWMPLTQLAKEAWQVRRPIYEKLASYFRDFLTE